MKELHQYLGNLPLESWNEQPLSENYPLDYLCVVRFSKIQNDGENWSFRIFPSVKQFHIFSTGNGETLSTFTKHFYLVLETLIDFQHVLDAAIYYLKHIINIFTDICVIFIYYFKC